MNTPPPNRPCAGDPVLAAARRGDGTTRRILDLEALLRRARHTLGADVTLQRLLILICVRLHEGLSQAELRTHLEATSVTALSRNLADLSAWTSRKQPGPGLLELRADPMNLRRKTVHLTDRGHATVAAILGDA